MTLPEKTQTVDSVITDRFGDNYFVDRYGNNPLRLRQFKQGSDYVNKFISSGILCDVGYSTGEFLRVLNFDGKYFGMEINKSAREEAEKFISFDKNIFTETNFFDLVIFRRTIQHVDLPFQMLKVTSQSIKPVGYVIFLATPNSNSFLYKMKNDLPFIDWPICFYIPGKKDLANALSNYGFIVRSTEFPYWKTPYRRIFHDHFFFILNLISGKFFKHAFWGSSMNMAAQKPFPNEKE